VGLAEATPIVWDVGGGGNGHAYEFVAAPAITWTDAATAASTLTYQGNAGYLVTITSQAENDFIITNFGTAGNESAWIGASDSVSEDVWVWTGGPESGVQFWQGLDNGVATPPFNYANWSFPDPNNAAVGPDGEDYAVIKLGTIGADAIHTQWIDANNAGVNVLNMSGYIAEYVPEPSTVTLLGLGLLSTFRRRRGA
jgi:hypothetical protein